MTPLLAALSSLTYATRSASLALSASPESAASRKLRTAVLSDDLTALLRCLAFSFCLLRLIWDLMFATRMPRYFLHGGSGYARREPTARKHPAWLGAGMRAAEQEEYPRSGPSLKPRPI